MINDCLSSCIGFNDLLMSPEELSKVLQSHQVWLTSGYKEGERANLEGADLQEVDGLPPCSSITSLLDLPAGVVRIAFA
jgi:hypothetical protein